ncbi:MAG: hypothetical protein LBU37_03320 [Tannerellaceae bacterium]|jgi:hypothetical protein|nr:hypothetical protein [Tannerellaceae bacterium]
MRYFRIKIRPFFEGRIVSDANGEFVADADLYFTKIRYGEIVENTPIFDYFHLQSFDKKEFWEWKLQDVYRGGWEYPGNRNWYISDRFKLLLERYIIASQYHFYETRLLYKYKKLKYWIFQFPVTPYKNIDFSKSEFILEQENKVYNFSSEEEYTSCYRKTYKEVKKKMKCVKIYLKDICDITKSTNNDIIVSERLKIAMEKINIEGFEFSELDYEIIVEK